MSALHVVDHEISFASGVVPRRGARPAFARVWVPLAFLLLPAPAPAADLDTLVEKYKELQTKLPDRHDLQRRKDFVDRELQPLLGRIGELDTDESFRFLSREIDTARPVFAAACAPAILRSSRPDALLLIVRNFARRPAQVREGVLDALAATSRDLTPIARHLLQIARSERDPEVKKSVPAAVGKLDTLTSAKTLVEQIAPLRDRKQKSALLQLRYNSAVIVALVGTRNDAVKEWLEADAFKQARGSGSKLEVLARAAARLGIEAARPELEKILEHSDPFAAAAAVDALVKIRIGSSVDKLIHAFEKGKARTDLRFRTKALDALATTDDENAMKLLMGVATGKDDDMRSIAMGSLAMVETLPALKALLTGLEDANPNVRSTTLVALARKRRKEMIAPLIGYLGKEKQERLRVDALKILVGLTGVNMGFVVADWKKWWKTAEPTFELPEVAAVEVGATSIRRATAEDIKIVPKYFGLEVTATNRVSFLVDVSGSMGEMVSGEAGQAQKIAVLRKELTNVIKNLPSMAQINIISFNDNYRPWKNQLHSLGGKGRRQAIGFVSSLRAQSSTNIYDTLEFALKDRKVDTIFLLSDGAPTAGRITDPNAILQEVTLLNRARGVTINCIAFGTPSPFLRQLAEKNKGEYRFVEKL